MLLLLKLEKTSGNFQFANKCFFFAKKHGYLRIKQGNLRINHELCE
ncbi:hypothetical protein G3A_01290 [Bacillus sp. 17376]|nr:hypothetical protein G3A_01290 [Bacillus sp. 17376]